MHDIPLKAIIEIGQDSPPVKYEFEKGELIVDRFLSVSMRYPCNYGYIENTLADDGDPLDVLVITRYPIVPGAKISVRSVGVLNMSDEAGHDVKIIAVPDYDVDSHYKNTNDISDLNEHILNSIKHFFVNYKTLDAGKFTKVDDFGNKGDALQIIKAAMLKANENS